MTVIAEPLPLEHHRGVLLGAVATATAYWVAGWTDVTPLWAVPITVATVVVTVTWSAVRRGYWAGIAETAFDHMMMHPYQPHHPVDVARAINVRLDVARVTMRAFVAAGWAALDTDDDGDVRFRLTERGVTYGRDRAS
jgi:hypothetical protein